MDRQELAALLVDAEAGRRSELVATYPSLVDARLAAALKDLCYEAFARDPPRAIAAAVAAAVVAAAIEDDEAAALAAWTGGIASLVRGQMREALAQLDAARDGFASLGLDHIAASTQVSAVYALAMLGRYDEAVARGLQARDTFLAHGDTAAAGRVEQNLGNLDFRRDRYGDAERLYRMALARFLALDDARQLAQIENCLATALQWQHRFDEAATLYARALVRAEAAGETITQAEIECNTGLLALLQGQYDRALDYLERCRRRYAALGLEHRAANSERELADAYLELNLLPEAASVYIRLAPRFRALGLRADEAWTLAHLGRTRALLRQPDADRALDEARVLYAAEGNALGVALVALFEGQLHYAEGRHAVAAARAAEAEAAFAEAGSWGRALLAGWLRGESLRAAGHPSDAATVVEATLTEAERRSLPQVAQRCHTSLGLIAAAAGDRDKAETSLTRAAALLEDLRAPLPAEEFRTAFMADKLTPYVELVRLCLEDRARDRTAEALTYAERAKSRALLDLLEGALPPEQGPRDAAEGELANRLRQLREELNWLYSLGDEPPDPAGERGIGRAVERESAIREREAAILAIARQLRQSTDGVAGAAQPAAVSALQARLGPDTAFVEYFSRDDELLAFVVTNRRVSVVRGFASLACVEETAERLRFQMGALRHGAARLAPHLDQLTARARHHLARLYDLLLRPLDDAVGDRRLAIAPHRGLHILPFHALFDGERYVVERREVVYAPSAAVLRHCLASTPRTPERAVLLGVPDAETPRLRDEVTALAALFPHARLFVDGEATQGALREHAVDADVLHIACHGRFRPDSPLFSALRLADGWLTARDAYALDLEGALVTLSACESGVSSILPGDEPLGLARGFLSAGARSLLLSLWLVDDESTAALMTAFYRRYCAGTPPGAALREAQCDLLREYPHPFFWSPFAVFGRW